MNIVITGCSTGIGEACARRLDRGGHRVFAGVRRDLDGERLRSLVVDEIAAEALAKLESRELGSFLTDRIRAGLPVFRS